MQKDYIRNDQHKIKALEVIGKNPGIGKNRLQKEVKCGSDTLDYVLAFLLETGAINLETIPHGAGQPSHKYSISEFGYQMLSSLKIGIKQENVRKIEPKGPVIIEKAKPVPKRPKFTYKSDSRLQLLVLDTDKFVRDLVLSGSIDNRLANRLNYMLNDINQELKYTDLISPSKTPKSVKFKKEFDIVHSLRELLVILKKECSGFDEYNRLMSRINNFMPKAEEYCRSR